MSDAAQRANAVVPLQTCARPLCDELEYRVNGYCSTYCEDIDERDQQVAELKAALADALAWLESLGAIKNGHSFQKLEKVLRDARP